MTMSTATADRLVCLVIEHAGQVVTYDLKPDSNVIVGSDDRCGLRVFSGSVSPRHCMIRQMAGEIIILDWFSESGTFVNGQRITEETTIQSTDQVLIGECELRLVIRDAQVAPISHPVDQETIVSVQHSAVYDGAADNAESSPVSTADDNEVSTGDEVDHGMIVRLQVELAQAREENAFLRQELEAQLETPTHQPLLEGELDAATRDEIETLRAQNRQLQMDLEERDAALMKGWDPSEGELPATPTITSSETEALVERLEQLLDELQSADRRISTLDDLLRSSAEENRAEMEERAQLENWVGEIEKRIGEREEDWAAERASLEAKIAELKSRPVMPEMPAHAADAKSPANAAERIVLEWRRKYEIALEQLEAAHRETGQLKKTLAAHAADTNMADRIRELESTQRQKDVELSQERATVARMRAEIDRMRVDADRMPRTMSKANETDIRIQAFRAHLKGIHEQEQIEKREHKSQGLAARLGKLWQRLDGN